MADFEGITSMMKASKPGMFCVPVQGRVRLRHRPVAAPGPGFPSIISAGKNNFCIHYYCYTGQAQDGDMVLNDVGARHDYVMTDVSRGWPCNGKFNERQTLLYNIALETSNHMFSIIKPGMAMKDVDGESRRYCAQL